MAPIRRHPGVAGGPSESGSDRPLSEPEAWAVLLSTTGLGPVGFSALLADRGSARGVLVAAGRAPEAGRLGRLAAAAENRPRLGSVIGRELSRTVDTQAARAAQLRESHLGILTLDDPEYPARLRAIEQPPPVLFISGAAAALSAARSVAIVGTRRPTEHGRLLAARIAGAIVRSGGAVISGLAVGIDGAAHAAAVAEGGRTVAVLGSGHERLFPRAHAALAGRIVELDGAVISELWPDIPASTHTFPRRNRVISALADATVVVEAGIRSGALITARHALEQGRDLFVVPGGLDEPRSAGCLEWLRSYPGEARIVASIPGLIADLGLSGPSAGVGSAAPGRTGAPRPSLAAELIEVGPTAGAVGRALVAGHGTLDDLVAATGHEPATILSAITLLELRGLATTTYGRYRPAGRLASAPAAERE